MECINSFRRGVLHVINKWGVLKYTTPGILALGAMAEGGFLFLIMLLICVQIGYIAAIERHLPTQVPYLINMLNDPKVKYAVSLS